MWYLLSHDGVVKPCEILPINSIVFLGVKRRVRQMPEAHHFLQDEKNTPVRDSGNKPKLETILPSESLLIARAAVLLPCDTASSFQHFINARKV
jgi:hypothetical protein